MGCFHFLIKSYLIVSLTIKQSLMLTASIPKIKHSDTNHFFLLAGPCAIEGEEMALRIAEKVAKVTDQLRIPYIFKGSFKKPIVQESTVLRELAMKRP